MEPKREKTDFQGQNNVLVTTAIHPRYPWYPRYPL
jgi:hypothetical protein